MGFLNKALGMRGRSTHQDAAAASVSGDAHASDDSGAPRFLCPDCGEGLSPDPLDPGAYECLNEDCLDESDIPTAAHVPGMCSWCQSSLSSRESYMPYEEGGNEDAYVVCPGCQQKILQ
jgi:DNA-directed RNA polymerase subunit RPC12/RpoP